MRTLIVPVDFSAASVNAANYALNLANDINASIILMYIYQIPIALNELPIEAGTAKGIIEDAEKSLEELKEGLSRKSPHNIKIYTEIREGMVVTQVEEYCKLTRPYAVVMGASGAGKAEKILFGSNTLAAMKQVSWPLIIVPKGIEYKGISKIGLASDLLNVVRSVNSDLIIQIVKDFKASLHIVHVNQEPEFSNEQIEGAEWMRDLFAEVNPQFHFLDKKSSVEESINEFAMNNNLDLLIVIPKKYGLLEGIFHKSRAKEVALNTHLPILSIHE